MGFEPEDWGFYEEIVDPFDFTGSKASEAAANTEKNMLAAQRYAVDQQRAATTDIIDETREAREQARDDVEPWRTTGGEAVNTLADKVAAGPGDYTQSPGYDFRLEEGQKRLERSAAARGDALDPSTGKALVRYGQDYATGDYDNFLRRYYDSLTPLQSLSGVGMTSAGYSGDASQRAAGQIGGALQNQSDTLGSLAVSTSKDIANLNIANQARSDQKKSDAMGIVGSIVGAVI